MVFGFFTLLTKDFQISCFFNSLKTKEFLKDECPKKALIGYRLYSNKSEKQFSWLNETINYGSLDVYL